MPADCFASSSGCEFRDQRIGRRLHRRTADRRRPLRVAHFAEAVTGVQQVEHPPAGRDGRRAARDEQQAVAGLALAHDHVLRRHESPQAVTDGVPGLDVVEVAGQRRRAERRELLAVGHGLVIDAEPADRRDRERGLGPVRVALAGILAEQPVEDLVELRRQRRSQPRHPSAYRDAQGFRKNGEKLKVKLLNASVYHYGWVKSPNRCNKKLRMWQGSCFPKCRQKK